MGNQFFLFLGIIALVALLFRRISEPLKQTLLREWYYLYSIYLLINGLINKLE